MHANVLENTMSAAPILLLDVMSTLVYDPFRVEMPAFFGMSFQQMLEYKHPTAWPEFERGEIDDATFFAKFFRDGRDIDIAAFHDMLRGSYRWLDGIEPLLTELRDAGVSMHTLSNYPTWYTLIEESLGLSRYLPWTFVSCHIGARKPDAEIYEHAARHLGEPPGRFLFVDDRESNCQGARDVGMGAVRFEGAHGLRAALVERGVL